MTTPPVDVDLIEDITDRAEHMRLGLAKYPVDEIKALCAGFRRLRAAENIRRRIEAVARREY